MTLLLAMVVVTHVHNHTVVVERGAIPHNFEMQKQVVYAQNTLI